MKLFKEKQIHCFHEIKNFENKTYWSLVVIKYKCGELQTKGSIFASQWLWMFKLSLVFKNIVPN
jgi:hypothetical protein